ncbi:MAG TPA: phosphoesterase [Candidatus Bathyarchaeia archaeon]|nr:phosphoesterase [Candidatus Bathyarchaeia archaeon]
MNLTNKIGAVVNEPQPLVNEPALIIGSALVLADLHLGIEHELESSGITIPSQVDRRIDRALQYLASAKAQRFILLGDVKNTIPSTSALERHDIPHFLRSLAECAPVDIICGNHDPGIKYWCPRDSRFPVEIHAKGCQINGVGLVHGHAWPSLSCLRCAYVIMGHNHPKVRLSDPLGHVTSKPVWVRTRFVESVFRDRYPDLDGFANPRVIIMPAFNELLGGIAFNEESYETLLGPLFSNQAIELEKAQVYLLDGTYLGTIGQLRRIAPSHRKSFRTVSPRKKNARDARD